jgi:uncharacterized protein YndB with AHSA1/START domain
MTSNATQDVPILGSLGTADGRGVVRMEDEFETDVADLWSALTTPERLARWLGEVEGDFRLGGEFRAHFFASGWEGTGRVEACEPARQLRVQTTDVEGKETHSIEATLAANGERTRLVIQERGMPVDHLAGYGAGIQIHVEDLAAYLAGRERVPQTRWDELIPAYQDLLAKMNVQKEGA